MKELNISELLIVSGGTSTEVDFGNYVYSMGGAAAFTYGRTGSPHLAALSAMATGSQMVIYDVAKQMPISVHENQLPKGTLIPSSFPIGPNYNYNSKLYNNQSGSDYQDGCNYQ